MSEFKLQAGDTKLAKEIGKRGTGRYIWLPCASCGVERWVMIRHGKPQSKLCSACSAKKLGKAQRGKTSPRWKGGRHRDKEGYIQVKLAPDDPFYCMVTANGYVREHRLVMARCLGRPLESTEIVHHVDGKRDHNSEDNLHLTKIGSHNQWTYLDAYQRGYREGIADREAEMKKQLKLLRWEIKQLREALQLRLGGKDGSI